MARDFTARLTVSDGRGGSDSATVVISPGNTPPDASLTGPTTWKAGDALQFTASATDPQEGALTGAKLVWVVRLRHADHLHNVSNGTGSAVAFTATNDHDSDSQYEVTLTATDSRGLTDQATAIVRPQTAGLTLASVPPGAPIGYGGTTVTAPSPRESTIGLVTTISAAEQFTTGGKTYEFVSWSDGGARVHNVTVPSTPSTLTAT